MQAEIISATNPEQALKMVTQRDQIALILLDLQLPGVEGSEFAQQIQNDKDGASIPVIVITANPDEDYDKPSYLSGVVDHIKTPINKKILLSRVGVFLDLWLLRSKLNQEVANREAASCA